MEEVARSVHPSDEPESWHRPAGRPCERAGRDRELLPVLGVEPQIGRMFSAIDAAPEREPRVVVVTAGFWRSYLRADPAAIGESLTLNGEPFTVVGVLPDGYRGVTGWVGPQVLCPTQQVDPAGVERAGKPQPQRHGDGSRPESAPRRRSRRCTR